jgi:hypothetical protein
MSSWGGEAMRVGCRRRGNGGDICASLPRGCLRSEMVYSDCQEGSRGANTGGLSGKNRDFKSSTLPDKRISVRISLREINFFQFSGEGMSGVLKLAKSCEVCAQGCARVKPSKVLVWRRRATYPCRPSFSLQPRHSSRSCRWRAESLLHRCATGRSSLPTQGTCRDGLTLRLPFPSQGHPAT